MTDGELRQLLIAPEMIVLDLADATLLALRRALTVEHPTLSEFPSAQASAVLVRAAAVLHATARLRRAVRAYRRAVDVSCQHPCDNLPF